MVVGKFVITKDIKGTPFVCEITKHKNNDEVTYDVLIVEPDMFSHNNELGRPLKMKYDPTPDKLVFYETMDNYPFLEWMETLLSDEIMERDI